MMNADEMLMSRALDRLRAMRKAMEDPMEKNANGLVYIISDLERRLCEKPLTERQPHTG